ncbi:MAG: Na+/H+ antiporter NhaC [Bacteroidales bacterium]|nr:Na+/H+ antiporter NhaC [Bacteroidales bacterium]
MIPEKGKLSLFYAFIPVFFLIVCLSANFIIFREGTLDGSNQLVLLFAAAIASLLAIAHGTSWGLIQQTIVDTIGKAMPAMLILLLIGSLAGTWLLSGVVPSMIYYGLKIINPRFFLFTAVVVCCLVSLATGSSWSTIATIGVALLGIGKAIGIHEGLVAGAIISGAYFGDKMSPLSDTTNLAPAVAGTDLFTHIRYMAITTAPSIILATVAFAVIGFFYDFNDTETNIPGVLGAIGDLFTISPLLLLVPAILIAIIMMKIPPIPSLLIGTLTGGVFAVIFQPHLINEIAGITADKGLYFLSSYKSVMVSMFGNVDIASPNEIVDELFTTSGMAGMLNTVWLILSAMIFGGAMEAGGMLRRITHAIISVARSTGSLIASTMGTSVFFNLTASDQYISIVVPGKMFADSYRERGLKPEVLSRTLEDAGTLTSVLVPWNTCGATQARVLGVSTLTYLPYCFFNLINPIVAVIIAYTGYKIKKTEKKQSATY